MRINIEGLGAISHISIDLSKGMCILCGPNSTGKTYASYVLYAFLSMLPDLTDVSKLSSVKSFVSILKAESDKTQGSFVIGKSDIEEWLGALCENVQDNIGDIFGIGDDTCAKLFPKFKMNCTFSDEDYKKVLKNSYKALFGRSEVPVITVSKDSDSDILKIETNIDDDLETHVNGIVVINKVLRDLILGKNKSARMLTVERNSIYTFKTELSISRNELIDQIQRGKSKSFDLLDFLSSSSRRYPFAVKDSLRVANDLETIQKKESNYAVFAHEIEHGLLRGDVSMTKNGDVEFHSESMPKTRRLPFHMSSSIVKTMASFVIYLKHLAKNGDTLIIDEPEMNFHPDVQVELARVFAKLVNNGLNIVISTHSDYIVRELNNMIMSGVLCERGFTDHIPMEYLPDCILKKNQLEVLFLVKQSKGVVSKLIPITDTGFDVETIDATITRQNNNAELLYDCILSSNEN